MSTLIRPATEKSSHVTTDLRDVQDMVAKASDIVSPAWSIKNFVTVNPLQGLETQPFEQAVMKSERYRAMNARGIAGREAVNRELIKWCMAYFDEGQAIVSMPGQKRGLYGAFVDLAPFDSRLNGSVIARRFLNSLPEQSEEAIKLCLLHLSICSQDQVEFVRQGLSALPGWSGYVKWKEQWQNAPEKLERPATLVELIAVRLVLTCLLWPDASVQHVDQLAVPTYVAELPTAESRFRQTLLNRLIPHAVEQESISPVPADAQLVFCIDIRSEPFRRAIEKQGAYETFGFAGSFGLPVRVKGYDAEVAHDSCSVLQRPRHEVHDLAVSSSDRCSVQLHQRRVSLRRQVQKYLRSLTDSLTAPFVLAEIAGPWLGLKMVMRTFVPLFSSRVLDLTRQALIPEVPTSPSLHGIPTAQQADYAETLLRLIGLTENFAPLVVFCGHGSTTTNNPFASALDCGACGGNHGGANARIMAAILNCPAVRSLLLERGVKIPADTIFVGAEHNTTTDVVELFAPQEVSQQQGERLNGLNFSLVQAGEENARVRMNRAGTCIHDSASAQAETARRSQDWSEVRPDSGLSRNAAFIAGPRSLTENVDLDGRCFLHSYDWKADATGKILTSILTTPMVVAQWINSQYLFSALDNVAYGSGSKVTQNLTGRIGIMQGNASDLMYGLPLQSLSTSDDRPYHEPLRLLTVVYAPQSRVEAIVHSQHVLKKLFGNGWVSLVCIDPESKKACLLQRDLKWQSV